MNKGKVLIFDIETTPNTGNFWHLGKQYVSHEQIRKEREIICICYKWVGRGNKIETLSFDQKKYNLATYDDHADKSLLQKFSKIFNEADLVVAHNGKRFDIAVLRSRLLINGLTDLVPVLVDDTYLATKNIGLNCHKLDYIGRVTGLGRKKTEGVDWSLWNNVMNGSSKALKHMIKYCEHDVRLLEAVYNKVKPFIKSKLNLAVLNNKFKCPSCLGKLTRDGVRMTSTLGVRQRYLCTNCGKHCTTGENLLSKSSEYPR